MTGGFGGGCRDTLTAPAEAAGSSASVGERIERIGEARGSLSMLDVRVVADLDCDSALDTVELGMETGGDGIVRIVRSGVGGRQLQYRTFYESMGEPAVVADVDGDGVRDLIMQWFQESEVTTYALLLRSHAVIRVSRGVANDVAVVPENEACFGLATPRVQGSVNGPWVEVPVHPGWGAPTDECDFDRARFVVFHNGWETSTGPASHLEGSPIVEPETEE